MYGPYKNNILVESLDEITDTKIMMHVVTTKTKDYGDKFTVRRVCTTKQSHAMGTLYLENKVEVCDTLEDARKVIPEGFGKIDRFPDDDPIIVEVWI